MGGGVGEYVFGGNRWKHACYLNLQRDGENMKIKKKEKLELTENIIIQLYSKDIFKNIAKLFGDAHMH